MPAPALIAKLTRPRLYAAAPRERLFALLDAHRARPAVWLDGPPGAGKTTLVTSYLEARGLGGIWYQVDAGDDDPAAFFHYLGQAVNRPGVGPMPLPVPEQLADPAAFARRFFRELYERLGAPAVVVLDNYQEAPLASPFHILVAEAIGQIPEGIRLLVVSRTGPPAQHARHLANGDIARLDSEALRLRPEETAALVTACHGLDAAALQTLHARANGWAAGVVLMSEHLRRNGSLADLAASESMETVFAYFAEEILSRAAADVRDFLLRTAFLPQITVAAAEALSGNPEAGAILDGLYRRHWFTDRRTGAQTSYQYHALFREFLCERAAASLPAAELTAIQRLAASLLADNGQLEAAVRLFAEIQDWPALTRLVAGQAPCLTAQGRYSTLNDWIGRVPEAVIDRTPWLLFWRGRARMPFDPAGSLPDLERAFARFRAGREPAGIFSAWGGIVNAIVWDVSGDLRRLDPWMDLLDGLRAEYPAFSKPGIDWLVAYAAFCALYMREPQHPRTDKWKARALELARRGGDPTQLLPTLHMALLVNLLRGDLARAAVEMAEYPQIGELNQQEAQTSLLYFGQTYFQARTGAFAACLENVDRAMAASEASGIRAWDHQVLMQGVVAALSLGDRPRAGALMARLATDPRIRTGHAGSIYHAVASWYAHACGEGEQACVHAMAACTCAEAVGSSLIGVARFALAQALHAHGQPGAARAALGAALDAARTLGSRSLEHMCRMTEADFDYAAGDYAAGDAALREGLRLGRDERYLSFPWWRREVMARLCARALEIGSEPDYVAYLIRARGLYAPSAEVENWPWPVRVYTLGRFSVVVDGEPAGVSHKAPKRPITLLQALIALGGRDVDEWRLAQALASESDDDCLKTLGMTLLRLRKLLGRAEAVSLVRGKLSLDTRLCWVDAWAFERGLAHAGQPGECPQALEKALLLYHGPLLAREPGLPWMLAPRQGLHDKFLQGLRRHGRRLEDRGDWDAAAGWYRRGLETDPSCEALYLGLMRCHERRGEVAEAIRVYQRCRDMLSMLLGIPPGAETESLRARLVAGSAAPGHDAGGRPPSPSPARGRLADQKATDVSAHRPPPAPLDASRAANGATDVRQPPPGKPTSGR